LPGCGGAEAAWLGVKLVASLMGKGMPFTHILITRPRQEALQLAEMLLGTGAETIIMPTHDFHATALFPDQLKLLRQAAASAVPPWLIFTSPRSIEHGLGQIPAEVLQRARFAAIGPSTAGLLEQAGLAVTLRPQRGSTTEDLLDALDAQGGSREASPPLAFICAAPGGRTELEEGLRARGYQTHMLMVYASRTAELEADAIAAAEQAPALLAIWTSANSMNSLAQRLPAACWSRICRGEWLVISERLRRVARSFAPGKIHLSGGPTNSDIVATIQAL
jgi:uroporphyrinogen-III synthase